MGFQVDKQSQVLSKTILSYFSSLQAYHVDHRMLLQLFKGPRLRFFIKSGKRSFPYTKAVRLRITKRIPVKFTRHQPTNGDKLSIDEEFKVAYVGLIFITKITFTAA